MGPVLPRLAIHNFGDQKRQRWDSSGEKADRPILLSSINLNQPELVDGLIENNFISVENNMLFVLPSVMPKSFSLNEIAYQSIALQLACRWFPYEHEPL